MAPEGIDSRTRYRNPLGYGLMVYKGLLGLGEVAVGLVLAMPFLDGVALFRRLSAEELREDPGDFLVGFLSRHLPALLAHRVTVAVALLLLGGAKVAAAMALYNGREWGRYALAALVIGLLPFDLRAALLHPHPAQLLVLALNALAAVVLVAGFDRTLHLLRKRRVGTRGR
jgi:uncharacterized membrane protein